MGINESSARTYVQEDNVYSFQFPNDWKYIFDEKTSYFYITPPDNIKIICSSKSLPSIRSKGVSADESIKSFVENKISAHAIKAGDPKAKNFSTSMIKIENGNAEKTVFETINSKQIHMKKAMALTVNAITGHTVDVTCSAPINKWIEYETIFQEILSSLQLRDGSKRGLVPPSFLGEDNKAIQLMIDEVRRNITRLKINEDTYIQQETEEELSKQLVPFDIAKKALNRGVLSAMAQHCNLDWQNRSFLPLMKSFRNSNAYTEKQLSFLAALHGFTQHATFNQFKSKDSCSATLKENTDTFLVTTEQK